ncbi:hypothetical protein AADZ91_09960 [Colwelliaceae bacterium 6441]
MKYFLLVLSLFFTLGCSNTYTNQSHVGKVFPSVSGESLEKNQVNIPQDFKGKQTLLLIGYKQNSQFDIDRWLIGLDMTKTTVDVYEIPTIQGLFPRMFSTFIDDGMRAGIPKPLWKGVITVYKDGDKVQKFTGNENPNNARVILLNENGMITFMYDDGFSVSALNEVRDLL